MNTSKSFFILLLALSTTLVACSTEVGHKEKINRGKINRDGNDVTVSGELGKLTLQTCSNNKKILNLGELSQKLRTGVIGQDGARLTTLNFNLFDIKSQPLENVFDGAAKETVLQALIREGLSYASGRISDVLATDELLMSAEQDECKTVKFGTAPAFDIQVSKSNSQELMITNAKGTIVIYRLVGDSSVQIQTYYNRSYTFCGKTEEFILSKTVQLDIGSRASEDIDVSQELFQSLYGVMDLPSSLEAKIRGQSNNEDEPLRKSKFTLGTIKISDADYLGTADRLQSAKELLDENKPVTDITSLPTCVVPADTLEDRPENVSALGI